MAVAKKNFILNSDSTTKENTILLNTLVVLDEKKQNDLFEILKCTVCFELPKDKQVYVCEEGHHFCSSCYQKLTCCGMCRGKLLKGRNFVVEELVKIFHTLWNSLDNEPLPLNCPLKLTSGMYKCQHQCQAILPAFNMLQHIRDCHSCNLIENVCSNPYIGKFSWFYNVKFESDTCYPLSFHISDIGLFTALIVFRNFDLFAFVKVLGNATVSSMIRYQLLIKLLPDSHSKPTFEYSVTDCPVAVYNDDIETVINSGNILKLSGSKILEKIQSGCPLSVFISIWKKENLPVNNNYLNLLMISSNKQTVIVSNRKIRRNKNRNKRRKNAKKIHRHEEVKDEILVERFARVNF